MLLHVDPQPGEIYNIGGSKSLTVGEILEYLLSLSNFENKIDITIDQSRLRPIDADLQVPSTKKFQSHTNWTPEINYKKTLKDLLEYWRKKIETTGSFINR